MNRLTLYDIYSNGIESRDVQGYRNTDDLLESSFKFVEFQKDPPSVCVILRGPGEVDSSYAS